jgi:hypothetical protein
MLHWPDTMFTYMDGGAGEHILFSNDGFGQHYATESLFDDGADRAEVFYEAMKYWANILNLYARRRRGRSGRSWPWICRWTSSRRATASSGAARPWRSREIPRWGGRLSGKAGHDLLRHDVELHPAPRRGHRPRHPRRRRPDVTVKLFNSGREAQERPSRRRCFRSAAVLVGSPTINYGYACSVAGMLELNQGAALQKEKGPRPSAAAAGAAARGQAAHRGPRGLRLRAGDRRSL